MSLPNQDGSMPGINSLPPESESGNASFTYDSGAPPQQQQQQQQYSPVNATTIESVLSAAGSPKFSNNMADINRSRSFNDGSARGYWAKDNRSQCEESGTGSWKDGPVSYEIDELGDRFYWEVHNVTLTRVPGFGFGIAVSGGTDNPHFASGDPSIAISDVLHAGPAEGKLQINDRIISANGVMLENIDNTTAIRVLMESGNTVSLTIKRKVLPPVGDLEQLVRKITLSKSKKKDEFGIVLGCKVYVKEIIGDSVAANEGSVKEGDYIVKINGTSVDTLSLTDAQKAVDKTKDKLNLLISRSVHRGRSRSRASLGAGSVGAPLPPSDYGYGRLPLPQSTPPKSSNIDTLQRLPSRNRNPVYESSAPALDGGGVSPQQVRSSEEESTEPRVRLPSSGHTPNGHMVPLPHARVITPNAPAPVVMEGYYSNVAHRMPPDPRFVSFRKEGNVGIRLTGGNEVGIFVAAVQPRSPAALAGLRPGDKILKVNDRSMENVTREDAVMFLLSLQVQDQIDLIVQYRRDEYERIVATQLRDSFYIRTHFNYEGDKGELSFRVGDIFHIKDTLHNGVVGAWEAARIGRNNQETQSGIIPNKSRAEQLALAAGNREGRSGSKNSGRGTFFRRKSARRSKSLNRDHWDEIVFSNSGSKFPAYEKIKWKYPGFVRPVVIFGPVADVVRDRLLSEMPDKFESPQVEVSEGHDGKVSLKAGIVRLGAIREIIETAKHAVVDITPNAVDRLNYAQYYPIVIFTRADSKNQVKALRMKHNKSAAKSSRKLFETGLKLEKMYSHLFTATVQLTNNDLWYQKLLDTIDRQQEQPIWMSDVKLEDNLDDYFLFPMTSRMSYTSGGAESDMDIGSDTEGSGMRPSIWDSFRTSQPKISRASSDTNVNEAPGYNIPPEDAMDQSKSRFYENERRQHGAVPVMPVPGEERYYSSYYGDQRPVHTSVEAYATLSHGRHKHSRPSQDAVVHSGYLQRIGGNGQPLIPIIDRGNKPDRRIPQNWMYGVTADASQRYPTDSGDQLQVSPQKLDQPEREQGADFRENLSKYLHQHPVNAHDDLKSQHMYSSASRTDAEKLSPDGKDGGSHDPYRYTRSTAIPVKPVSVDKAKLTEMSSRFRYSDRDKRTAVGAEHATQTSPARKLSNSESPSRPKYQVLRGTPQKDPDGKGLPTSDEPSQDTPRYPEPPKYHSPSYYRNRYGILTSSKDGAADGRPGSAERAAGIPPRYRIPTRPQKDQENDVIRENLPLEAMTRSYQGPLEAYNQLLKKETPVTTATTSATNSTSTTSTSTTASSEAIPTQPRLGDVYAKPTPSKDVRPIKEIKTPPSKEAKPNATKEVSSGSETEPNKPPVTSDSPSVNSTTASQPRRSAFEPYSKTNGVKDPGRPVPPVPPPKPPKPVTVPPATSIHAGSIPPIEGNHTVIATARGVFDSAGGVLASEETGVSIVIPKGAIPDGVKQEIYFKVCQDSSILPPLDTEKGETLLSPLVMCGPHGLKFQQPVELRLPHCASVNPESWSFALKSSETPTGQPTEWQNVQLAGVEGVSQGRVGTNSVSVLVDHF